MDYAKVYEYEVVYGDPGEDNTIVLEADEVSVTNSGYLFLNLNRKTVMGFRRWQKLTKLDARGE